MAAILLHRRGNTAAIEALTPDVAELLMNTDDTSLRLGNGSLAGGFVIGGKPYKSVSATTAYTIADADQGHLVVFNNSSSCTVTIPQAGAARNMPNGGGFFALNVGTAIAVLTPTTSLINGAASLTLNTGDGATVFSDGTNYWAIKALASGSSVSLASLSDVSLSSLASDDILTYNGSVWQNKRRLYPLAFSAPQTVAYTASQAIGYHRVAVAITIPANFASYLDLTSQAGGTANATASTVFSVDKAASAAPNTFSQIGTITIAAGGVVPTFATAGGLAQTFAQGDVLRVVAPVTPDTTFVGFYCSIIGYQT